MVADGHCSRQILKSKSSRVDEGSLCLNGVTDKIKTWQSFLIRNASPMAKIQAACIFSEIDCRQQRVPVENQPLPAQEVLAEPEGRVDNIFPAAHNFIAVR